MMPLCAVCGKPLPNGDREDHHFIPKFLYKYLNLEWNPDLYRTVLCKFHHLEVTKKWEIIRRRLKQRLGL